MVNSDFELPPRPGITPRHFLQSAQHAGVGAEIVHSIFEELRETGQEAIARTLDRLPARFPRQVSASIQAGCLRRFELIERERPARSSLFQERAAQAAAVAVCRFSATEATY